MYQLTIGLHSTCFPFFFNDTATTEIYTLSLHDALPISRSRRGNRTDPRSSAQGRESRFRNRYRRSRSEEHTSELQSQSNLVCRLLLEKKKVRNYLRHLVDVVTTTWSSRWSPTVIQPVLR